MNQPEAKKEERKMQITVESAGNPNSIQSFQGWLTNQEGIGMVERLSDPTNENKIILSFSLDENILGKEELIDAIASESDEHELGIEIE